MKKKNTPYSQFKVYYDKHRKLGWMQTAVFGPPELIEAVKAFVKQYKRDNGLYVRPRS